MKRFCSLQDEFLKIEFGFDLKSGEKRSFITRTFLKLKLVILDEFFHLSLHNLSEAFFAKTANLGPFLII